MAHAAWGPTGIGFGRKTHLYADYIWRLEGTRLLPALTGEAETDFWLTGKPPAELFNQQNWPECMRLKNKQV